MHKALALFFTTLLTLGCTHYSQGPAVAFVNENFWREDRSEVKEIFPRRKTYSVGDTLHLAARLESPDSLVPRLLWDSRNSHILKIVENAREIAIFVKPGTSLLCARVWYYFVPEGKHIRVVKNGNGKPACETYQAR